MTIEPRRPDDGPRVRERQLRFELDPRTSRGGTLRTKPVEIFEGESVSIEASGRRVLACGTPGHEAASIGLNLEQSPNRIDWCAPGSAAHLADQVEVRLEEPATQRWIRVGLTPESPDASSLRTSVWGVARRNHVRG